MIAQPYFTDIKPKIVDFFLYLFFPTFAIIK